MAMYASGSVRFNGLGSDNNFDETIKQLAKIERKQLNQFARWKQDWQTRLDAFKQVRGELMNLQSTLSSLNSVDKFLAKSVISTKEEFVTATANADAMNTSYDVVVGQKARASIWGKELGLHNKNDIINTTQAAFTYSYKGKWVTVDVPPNTTVQGFQTLINNHSKNPGVKAQLLQTPDGLIFQLQGMDTGKNNTLEIRDINNIPSLGTLNLTNQNYKSTAENELTFTGKTWTPATLGDPINTSSEVQTFRYSLDGNRYTVNVQPGWAINDLVSAINNQHTGAGGADVAFLKTNASGDSEFVLQRADTEYTFTPDPALAAFLNGEYHALGEVINPGGPEQTLTFTIDSSDGSHPDGQQYKVTLKKDATLNDLMNGIKFQVGGTADVKLVAGTVDPSKYKLSVEEKPKTHYLAVEDGTLDGFDYQPVSAEGWNVNHGCNALVRVNNYPADPAFMEMESNHIKAGELVPGVAFTLNGKGESTISVSNDTQKMQETIQEFVDAVNSARSLLMELTKVDSEKQTVDSEYAESQFEMQKGAVLTGNYGIQMIQSKLKNAIAGAAIGFTPMTRDSSGGYISGDVFSSLSQIGITTNADKGQANYGLLEINFIENLKGSKTLQQALEEDPEAIAQLFACTDTGTSNSDDFHYLSHVAGITKPGTYEVQYDVDGSGNIINATINGKPAKVDNDKYTITMMEENAAKGLEISISGRDPNSSHSGTVGIKTGKINEMLGLLDGSEGILGTNGTLRNLEKNYQGIIDGIDDKIQREDERLQRWETSMVMKFARLEAVLANYNGIQKSLESQISQLGGKK